jgi:tetratricopeptide (TPR) repeat protein
MTVYCRSVPPDASPDSSHAADRIERSRLLYEQAIFTGDPAALTEASRELDAVEAGLALARGRLLHGQFLTQRDKDPENAEPDPQALALFERAAQLYQQNGDARGEADAIFWAGCYHQVANRDDATAVPLLNRALALARQAGGDTTTIATEAEALRHLGIAAHRAGHLDLARQHLEDSTRLRREQGSLPSVAANMVGLIYIALGQGRHDDARALANEAQAIAESSGARTIARQLTEARRHLA